MAIALVLAGCGGGVDFGIVIGGTRIARLDIALSRSGPQSIRVDWTDDHYVDTYTVRRDGFTVATLAGTTLIDTSVVAGVQSCYQVLGYDFARLLVSASEVACITA